MIDWDKEAIINIQNHYNQVLAHKIDLIYFINHFEVIYRWIWDDNEILPAILNDITYYTLNGVNARDKLIFEIKSDEKTTKKVANKRIKQINQRHDAINKGLKEYYLFLDGNLMEFIEKYPQWKELVEWHLV